MAIVPVAFRVLIKPDPIETKSKTSSLVLVLDERLEKGAQTSGVVVAIGEDAFESFHPKTLHAGLKVGDRVFYARYAGKLIRYEGEEVLAVNDEDIVAKVVE